MSQRPPVTDWKTDFDHLDKAWVEDPFPIWAELRQTCPVAHTDRFRGLYLPTRYADIREIAYDTETFSSRRIMVVETPPPVNTAAPPITSDPPHHRPARMVLLPAFTPDAVARLEPVTRAVCRELIDAIDRQGRRKWGRLPTGPRILRGISPCASWRTCWDCPIPMAKNFAVGCTT